MMAATVSVGHTQERAPSVVITQVDRSDFELGRSQRLECKGSHCFGLVSLDVSGSRRTLQAFATLTPGYARVAVEPILPAQDAPVYLDRNRREPMVVPIGYNGIATRTFWLTQLVRPESPSMLINPVLRGPPTIGVRIDVFAPTP